MLRSRFEKTAQQGRFEEAIPAYKAALATNPNFALPLLLIADCLSRLGRFEQALAMVREGAGGTACGRARPGRGRVPQAHAPGNDAP
jgi:thioredoxin-like negative regulator of GroEL